MNIRFEDVDLQRMYEDARYRPRRWHRDIVRAYRKVVGWIADSESESDLYALRSLHYEKLKGDRVGQRSVRLNDQYRLILHIETKPNKTAVIVEVVDNH